MGFFSKKYEPSTELLVLQKDLELFKQKVFNLEAQMEIMNTSLKNMRGIINRKISGIKEDEEKSENSNDNPLFPKTKDIKPFSPFG